MYYCNSSTFLVFVCLFICSMTLFCFEEMRWLGLAVRSDTSSILRARARLLGHGNMALSVACTAVSSDRAADAQLPLVSIGSRTGRSASCRHRRCEVSTRIGLTWAQRVRVVGWQPTRDTHDGQCRHGAPPPLPPHSQCLVVGIFVAGH